MRFFPAIRDRGRRFIGMDESSSSNEFLSDRIQQLEQERDELHKEIERQAGPDFVAVATQMYFRRTAGLEQEIENLKKKLAACTKQNSALANELAEARRINEHLDQLRELEVAKNTELDHKLELLHGVVDTVASERRDAMLEAMKAKENEDLMSQKLNQAENRLLELILESTVTQEQLTDIQITLEKQEQEMNLFRKVISKFHKIRQAACSGTEEDESDWEDKCACLYNDPPEAWSFGVHQDVSTANYIAALQEQLKTLTRSVNEHRDKLQTETGSIVQSADPSRSVAQGLQEKQEEGHLFEVRAALRETLDELQRNLKQATKEKVDALMELAGVKQEYQLLLETTVQKRQGSFADLGERKMILAGRSDGVLKNMQRRSYLKRWSSAKENLAPVSETRVGHEGSSTDVRSSLEMDNARLQIENATVKDNLRSLKCLTSNIRKLRLSLMQAKETYASEETSNGTSTLVDEIIWEAELVKNSLGRPFLSREENMSSSSDAIVEERGDEETSTGAKIDSVSGAGLEMVELLILAAQLSREDMIT